MNSLDLNLKTSLNGIFEDINEILLIDREELSKAIEHIDINFFRSIIDDLLYQFFDIDGKELDYLMNKYYTF